MWENYTFPQESPLQAGPIEIASKYIPTVLVFLQTQIKIAQWILQYGYTIMHECFQKSLNEKSPGVEGVSKVTSSVITSSFIH